MGKRRWEPLGHYSFSDTDYVVFAKRKKNGLVSFKTIPVHSLFHFKNRVFPSGAIDPTTQWRKILEDTHG